MTSDAPDSGLARPWGRYALSDTGGLAVRVGGRDLWIRLREGEIRIAHASREDEPGDLAAWGHGDVPTDPSGDADWSRWAPPDGAGDVILRPALPDRAVVLQPEAPFRVLPGAEARVYVRVPVWIRVELPVAGTVHALARIPSVAMSDTWWGDLSAGELAYWLPTTARRAMSPELFAPHVAVCPLQIRNETNGELQVDKLALRVAHLSLFQAGDQVWADESRVRYLGLQEGSQIEMAGRAPDEAGQAVRISSPATPARKGLRARTFDRLRALQPIGVPG